MHVVTYCNIYSKCYINLFTWFCIVARGKRSSNVLVSVIANYGVSVFKNIKKYVNYYKSFFTVTIKSSPWEDTSQTNVLASDIFMMFTISEGIVVLSDFDFGFCNITLDFTSNNFIPPFLSFVINIYVNISYIIYLYILIL